MAAEAEIQERYFKQAGAVAASAYRAATKDGTIDAFLRQGANELGAALRAFPDSMQIDEPGAVFNPLYSDIAADKRLAAQASKTQGTADLASPSEIASGNAPGSVHGETQAASKEKPPSPSEIAKDQTPYQPEQDHSQHHGRSM